MQGSGTGMRGGRAWLEPLSVCSKERKDLPQEAHLTEPQAQMAKPATHVWKSVSSFAGGQEKDPFWGFCQTWS